MLTETDPAAVLAAAAEEDRGLDLTRARLDSAGYENLVLRTADGWILRFPRREEPDFDRELAVLRRLAGILPAATPEVAWTGTHNRLMAYRALDGASFDAQAYDDAAPRVRDRLAASLARFLAVLHTCLPEGEIAAMGIPATDHARQLELVTDRIERIPADIRSAARGVMDAFAQAWLSDPRPAPVLLHNDFHLLNMVLTAPVGEVSGVWDFTCVQTGAPDLDLRYFARVPAASPQEIRHDLLRRIADQYGRTGITLDPEAARVAMAMEDLVDGVLADDPHRIAAATDDRYG